MLTFLTLLKLEDQFQSHLKVGNQSPAQDTLSTGQWDSNFRMSAFNVPNGVVMVAGKTVFTCLIVFMKKVVLINIVLFGGITLFLIIKVPLLSLIISLDVLVLWAVM